METAVDDRAPNACVALLRLEERLAELSLVHSDVSELGREFVSTVLRDFNELYPTLEVARKAVPLFDGSSTGMLVRTTVMIQHDSMGDQFYVPIAKLASGSVANVDAFVNNALHFTDEMTENASFAELASRRLAVGVYPPSMFNSELSRPFDKLLLKFYGDHETRVNQLVQVVGFFEAAPTLDESEEALEYPYNLGAFHVILAHDALAPGSSDGVDFTQCRLAFLDIVGRYFSSPDACKILLALMSRITNRVQGLAASLLIGYYPLNICTAMDDASTGICEFLGRIVPHSTLIRLSPAVLDEFDFASMLDNSTGILRQGLLQVPDGTLVIIDERQLETGKLSERAAQNLQTLMDLVNHQVVSYDFCSQPVQISMDTRFISISHGKSILKMENVAKCTQPFELSELPSADELKAIALFVRATHGMNVEITDSVAADVEAMVESRCLSDSTRIDPNMLASALNVARLVTASHGRTEMALADIHEALELIA